MKQEEIDKLMNEIDKKCKLPKHWDEFIEKNSKGHYLIIKNTKEKTLYCTKCGQYFVDTKVKVKDYIKCPHCHGISFVYGMNYHRQSFETSIVLVQRLNKQVVIRTFEIYSYFTGNDMKIKRSCIEYARTIPGVGKFVGNNVDFGLFGDMRVYHGYKKINWSKYNGCKFFTEHSTYPYNKKKLIQGTKLQYAPINEFLDKFSYYRYNFLDVLEFASYESFEMLWKMKLYSLCFYSKSLNKGGSFFKRFGVPKSFLKYMQDKDVSYKELMLLRLFQKTDDKLICKYRYSNINHIKFLMKNNVLEEFTHSNNYLSNDTISLLKEISEYVPLKKLAAYSKGLNNLSIYRDYLKMSKKLALNYKSKNDLFPKNLIARHDKLQKELDIEEDRTTQFGAYLRFLELSKYIYNDEKYIIFPATSVESMKDEGRQQGNCVGHLYLHRYIDGDTEIFFARKLSDVNKSFITLEFKDGRIIQKELPHHSTNFEKEQLDFIDKWIGYRQFIDKKLKYSNKKKNEVIKYNLNKMVA